MTTDEKKCQRILDTQKKTGRNCTVTFNYRYAPPRTQVKDLLPRARQCIDAGLHVHLDKPAGEDLPAIKACRTFRFALVSVPPEERERAPAVSQSRAWRQN